MPDRVRESVFSILGSRFGCPGWLPALRVADVFAGSGSIGLEALSRGAKMCFFFEQNRSALVVLRKNLQELQSGPEAVVVPGDAWSGSRTCSDGDPFDLVFLDPPYADSADCSPAGRVARFLAGFSQRQDSGTLVVLHHRANTHFEELSADPWRVVDTRKMGTNAITFFER